jgi:hypothetical protein
MVKTTHTCGKSGLNIYLFGMKKTYETSLFSLVGRNADYTLHSVEPTPYSFVAIPASPRQTILLLSGTKFVISSHVGTVRKTAT